MWCSPVGTLALSQSLSPEHLYRACRGLNLAFTASPTKNIGCKGVCYAGSLQLVRLWVGSESGLEGTALTLPHAPPPSLLALIPAFWGGGCDMVAVCHHVSHTHAHTHFSLPPSQAESLHSCRGSPFIPTGPKPHVSLSHPRWPGPSLAASPTLSSLVGAPGIPGSGSAWVVAIEGSRG